MWTLATGLENPESHLLLGQEDTKEKKINETEIRVYFNNVRQLPCAYNINFRICEFGMITSVILNHRVVLNMKLDDILKVFFRIRRSPKQMALGISHMVYISFRKYIYMSTF